MTPAQFLKLYPQNLREIAESLRDLVRSTLPDATEKVYAGWKLIGYRIPDGRKGRYFCCVVPQVKENDVLLGFQYGIALSDPAGILEGKGTQVRFVRVQRAGQYEDAELIPLIEQAADAAIHLAHSR